MRSARLWAERLNLVGWLIVVALVLLWQFVIVVGVVSFDYLPKPTEVVGGLAELIEDGTLLRNLTHTLTMAFAASLIAVVLGVLLGTLMGMVKVFSAFTSGTVDFLRSIPATALMPVMLLLLGATRRSEILVAALAGLWPVLLNTIGGVQATNPRLREVGRALHLSRREQVLKVLIPSAVPAILVGVRLSVVTCLVAVIIAEIVINPVGIGWGLYKAQQSLRPDLLFAYAFVTGLLGYLVNVALIYGVRVFMPGSPALRGRA